MPDRGDIRKRMEEELFSSLNETPETPPSAPVEVPQDLLDLRKRLDAERRSLSKSKTERTVDEENWTNEDSLAASERFFSSLLLGWGDEMQIATQAQYESMFSGSDETYEDISKRLRQEYDERQSGFQERQPGAYLAADIAGAVPSAFVPGLGQAGLAARLGMAGSKLGKGVQTGLGVLTEGAIYGAGEAGEGRRLEGAAEGAVGSAVGYGVLRTAAKGLGGTVNIFTRKNVEGDLIDEAGNFTPITLMAEKPTGREGVLHTIYTDVIAPSFGGKGIITQQEKRVVEPIEKMIEQKTDMTKEMIARSKIQNQKAKEAFRVGTREMQNEFAAVSKAMKEEETAKTITPLKDKLKLLDSGKDAEIIEAVTKQQAREVDALEHHFRNATVIESMPAITTSKDLEDVLSIPSIQGQIKKLDELWTKKGYGMIKDKKIRINVNALEKSFAEMIENDEFFQLNMNSIPSIKKSIQKSIETVSKFRDKNNRIDGEILAQLRSDLGKAANIATDPQVKGGLYQTQSRLDDLIHHELTDTQKAQFKAERNKYKSVVVLRDAIESTSKVKGAFGPEDWRKSLDKNNKRDKRYGTGTLSKEADALTTQIEDVKKSIGKRGSEAAKAKAFKVQAVMEDHQAKLNKKIAELEAKQKGTLSRRQQDYDKLVEAKLQEPEIKAMKDEVKMLGQRLAQLKQLSATQNPSWFHTMAASQMLKGFLGSVAPVTGFAIGGPAGAALGTAATVAGTYGLGRGLATPTGQRLMAGQTRPQMATQRLLQADATGRTADILSRSVGRVGGTGATQGMLTGEPNNERR